MSLTKKFGASIKRARASVFAPLLDAVSIQCQIEAELLSRQVLADEKYSDPNRLERFGYKSFSQTDEDGIIAEIFSRIGVTNKTFLEFGVGRGSENNTVLTLYKGWHGLWIEANGSHCAHIRSSFANLIQNGRLTLRNEFVRPDNIDDIINKSGMSGEIDLLSVDIDGNDYHVFDAISCISPRVIVAEYNAKLPPPVKWVMPYNPTHAWDGSDYFGASLSAYEELARKKGYVLVGTNVYGINAFFVRNDLVGDKFPKICTPEILYNKARYYLVPFVKSGYPLFSGVLTIHDGPYASD
jgi:hypothetical protein